MAKKDKNPSGVSLGMGDVSTIRNILMGQQMNEYETRFEALKAELDAARQDLSQQLTSQGGDTSGKIDELQHSVNERFEKLEKMLEKRLDELDRRLTDTSTNDKRDLGKMLAEVAQRLLNE